MQYTTRHFTRSEDILTALSGLARLFHQATGEGYIAGIFESDVVWSLLLRCSIDRTARKPDTSKKHHDPGYIAPSWSWASVAGRSVLFEGGQADDQILQSAVALFTCVTPAKSDKFGAVIDGMLVLQGGFLPLTAPTQPAEEDSKAPHMHQKIYEPLTLPYYREYHLKPQLRPGQQFGLLRIATYRHLQLLAPSDWHDARIAILLIETCGGGVDGRDMPSLSASGLHWRRVGYFSEEISEPRRYSWTVEGGEPQVRVCSTLTSPEVRVELNTAQWETKTICLV